jgi:hypothetical protein
LNWRKTPAASAEMMTSWASKIPVASKGDFLLPQAARDMDMAAIMAAFMDVFCIIFYFFCDGGSTFFILLAVAVQRGFVCLLLFWYFFFHFFSRCSATGFVYCYFGTFFFIFLAVAVQRALQGSVDE